MKEKDICLTTTSKGPVIILSKDYDFSKRRDYGLNFSKTSRIETFNSKKYSYSLSWEDIDYFIGVIFDMYKNKIVLIINFDNVVAPRNFDELQNVIIDKDEWRFLHLIICSEFAEGFLTARNHRIESLIKSKIKSLANYNYGEEINLETPFRLLLDDVSQQIERETGFAVETEFGRSLYSDEKHPSNSNNRREANVVSRFEYPITHYRREKPAQKRKENGFEGYWKGKHRDGEFCEKLSVAHKGKRMVYLKEDITQRAFLMPNGRCKFEEGTYYTKQELIAMQWKVAA